MAPIESRMVRISASNTVNTVNTERKQTFLQSRLVPLLVTRLESSEVGILASQGWIHFGGQVEVRDSSS